MKKDKMIKKLKKLPGESTKVWFQETRFLLHCQGVADDEILIRLRKSEADSDAIRIRLDYLLLLLLQLLQLIFVDDFAVQFFHA